MHTIDATDWFAPRHIGPSPDERERMLQTIGTPSLEASLYDGSGMVTLVWLGRRKIAGIKPGVDLKASGRVSCQEGRRVIFNPRYELQA